MLTLRSTYLPYFHWPVSYDKPTRFLYPRSNPYELKLRPIQVSTDGEKHPDYASWYPTYWPAFHPLQEEFDEGSADYWAEKLKQYSPENQAKMQAIRETRKQISNLTYFFNPATDVGAFSLDKPGTYAFLWPMYPYISDAEKAKYREKWNHVLVHEFKATRSSNSITRMEYRNRILEILDFEVTTGFTPDWNNISQVETILPHYSEFAPDDQARLRDAFATRKRKLDTNDFSSIQELRNWYVAIYRIAALYFPWNDKTCQQYFPGYSDLSSEKKLEYQALRRKAGEHLYLVYSNNSSVNTPDEIWKSDLAITNFQYQNSAKEREFYRVVREWQAKIGDVSWKFEDEQTRNFYKSIINTDFSGGLGFLTIGNIADALDVATKVLIAGGALAITGGLAGAGILASAATATGVSATVTTGIAGAAATGGLGVIAGQNPIVDAKNLVKIGNELTPSLGVDLSLPGANKIGEKEMGLFDDVAKLGNETLNSLKSGSISAAGSSIMSAFSQVANVGNLTGEDAYRGLGSILSGVSVNDVVGAVAGNEPTGGAAVVSAPAPSSPAAILNQVSASVSKNKIPIALIVAAAAVAYMMLKGKK